MADETGSIFLHNLGIEPQAASLAAEPEQEVSEVVAPTDAGATRFLANMEEADPGSTGGFVEQTVDRIIAGAGKVGPPIAEGAVDFLPDILGALGFATLGTPGAFVGGAGGDIIKDTIQGRDIDLKGSAIEGGKQALIEKGSQKVLEKGLKLLDPASPLGKKLGFLRSKVFGVPEADEIFLGIHEANDFIKTMANDPRVIESLVNRGVAPREIERLQVQGFLASEATSREWLSAVEAFVDASATSDQVKLFKKAREVILKVGATDYVNFLGKHVAPEDMAVIMREQLEAALKPLNDAQGAAHASIGKTLTSAGMDVVDLGGVAGSNLARQRRFIDELPSLAKIDPEGVTKVIDIIDGIGERASYSAVKEARTALAELVEGIPKGQKRRFVSSVNEVRGVLKSRLDETIAAYDKTHGLTGKASLRFALDSANKLTTKFFNEQNSAVVRRFLQMTEPTSFQGRKAAEEMLKLRSAERIGQIRKLLGENSTAFRSLQTGNLANLFSSADGLAVSGKQMVDRLVGPKGWGETALKELYGERMSKGLIKLAKTMALKDIAAAGVSKSKMAISLAENGIWISIIGGVGLGAIETVETGSPGEGFETGLKTGAGIFLGLTMGAQLAARMIFDPKLLDAVISAARGSLRGRELVALLPRILAHATKDDEVRLLNEQGLAEVQERFNTPTPQPTATTTQTTGTIESPPALQ